MGVETKTEWYWIVVYERYPEHRRELLLQADNTIDAMQKAINFEKTNNASIKSIETYRLDDLRQVEKVYVLRES